MANRTRTSDAPLIDESLKMVPPAPRTTKNSSKARNYSVEPISPLTIKKDPHRSRNALKNAGTRESDPNRKEKIINKVKIALILCIWVTNFLCQVTKVAFCLAFVIFIRLVSIEVSAAAELAKGIVGCWREPSLDCLSVVKNVVFPTHKDIPRYDVVLFLKDAHETNILESVYEVKIPILVHNPTYWLIILLVLLLIYHWLSSFHAFLQATAGVMNVSLLEQTPSEEVYSHNSISLNPNNALTF